MTCTASNLDGVAVSEIDVDHLASVLQSGAPLIDVREEHEYTSGHVKGAVLVSLSSVPYSLDRFAADRTNYVACEFLAEQGIEAVNVAGGMLAWVNSGRETVMGDQPA
jgi:rhodanese-related sulfurtransferase